MALDPRAALPRVDTALAAAPELVARFGRAPVLAALRAVLSDASSGGELPSLAGVVAEAGRRLAAARPGPPRRVVNAAGVVVHTNLGRAPLSDAAVAAMATAAGTCDLELDLSTGDRGSRGARVDPLVAEACSAEDGLAVNNCAAALVLVLAALAGGRAVLVSRGELVEIGGSFRLPEIMASAGVRLVEVGTTNRTRAEDYRNAGDDVALILRVHRSNFTVAGFTEEPSVAALAEIAAARGVPLVHDCGSGLLDAPSLAALRVEPAMRVSLAAGADLVLASGDKLLGGPQAGLIAGRADLVDRCRRHPLARALRLDKLRIAALVVTLEAHLRGTAAEELPVWQALTADPAILRRRATALADAIGGEVMEGVTLVGGGSAPEAGVSGPLVRLAAAAPHRVAAALRAGDPPVVVRVADDVLWIDLRTVSPDDDAVVVAAVKRELSG